MGKKSQEKIEKLQKFVQDEPKTIPQIQELYGYSYLGTYFLVKKAEKEALIATFKNKKVLYVTLTASEKTMIDPNDPMQVWGLNRNLELHTEAADFYLLYDLSIDYPKEFRPLVEDMADRLAQQFSSYLMMAIGGELRHASNYCYKLTKGKNFGKVEGFVRNKIVDCHKNKNLDRAEFWVEWFQVVKDYGAKRVVGAAVKIFGAKWRGGGSYGGKKWQTAAKVLRQFIRGEINNVIFVDTAFGLYHNGNIIFDKIWGVGELKYVLDYNQIGNMIKVIESATPKVRDLYKAQRGWL